MTVAPILNRKELSVLDVETLFRLAPPVAAVLERAAAYTGRPYRERLAAYESAKIALESLVGYGSPDLALQCSEAWEFAIRHLTEVLDI